MKRTATFILKVETSTDGAVRRWRRSLKTMLRRDQLRCVEVREILPRRAGHTRARNPHQRPPYAGA
jgi:hypothetical protein